jgi:hypothetical protein
VRGFDDVEGVSPSLPKSMPRACLANSFSSGVLSWFIDVSSKETSASSSGELEELTSSEGHSLFFAVEDSASSSILRLPLFSLLDAILWRRERERVVG